MINILPSHHNPFVPGILETPLVGDRTVYVPSTTPSKVMRPVGTLAEARTAAVRLCAQNPGAVAVILVNDAERATRAGLTPIRMSEVDANDKPLFCCIIN